MVVVTTNILVMPVPFAVMHHPGRRLGLLPPEEPVVSVDKPLLLPLNLKSDFEKGALLVVLFFFPLLFLVVFLSLDNVFEQYV